jgi:hypothetical protein
VGWQRSHRAPHPATPDAPCWHRDLHISLTALPDDEPAADEAWDVGTAGWFSGIEAGRARFGIEPKEIGDPHSVAGIMHEVAHAWRQKHELIDPEGDGEEHLSGLTTIFLGFGVLTTNATERYRSWRTSRATAHQTKSMGYLPAPAMSWLLALQASVRGDKTELAALRRYLEPNQKGSLDEAIEEIAANPRYPMRYRIESSRPSTRLFVGARTPESDSLLCRTDTPRYPEPRAPAATPR